MKLEEFKRTVWNQETGECFGRTKGSWARIIAFYITLYSCLALLWILYFYIFHLTISDRYPKWQLDESIIGSNPGLGIRPKSPADRVESALISFKSGQDGDYQHWVNDINEFLESNSNLTNSSELNKDCSPGKEERSIDSFCPFDSSPIPPECTVAQNFSFAVGKPCILVKLNRIYGWKPKPYQNPPDDYPTDAPFTPGNIQITCGGQHDPDKEHLGPVKYYPSSGIDIKYYPFLNQPNYQSPYVMVQFLNPRLDTLVYIECRVWAKNIEYDRYNRKGMASFELFIEKDRNV